MNLSAKTNNEIRDMVLRDLQARLHAEVDCFGSGTGETGGKSAELFDYCKGDVDALFHPPLAHRRDWVKIDLVGGLAG